MMLGLAVVTIGGFTCVAHVSCNALIRLRRTAWSQLKMQISVCEGMEVAFIPALIAGLFHLPRC